MSLPSQVGHVASKLLPSSLPMPTVHALQLQLSACTSGHAAPADVAKELLQDMSYLFIPSASCTRTCLFRLHRMVNGVS